MVMGLIKKMDQKFNLEEYLNAEWRKTPEGQEAAIYVDKILSEIGLK